MILSMYNQAYIFLITIGLGFLSGFIYDIFRILRIKIKHNNVLIQIEDVIYWIVVTFIMFKFVISKNNGETRFFLIGGMVIGMVTYFSTLSHFIIKISVSIIHIIEMVIKTAIKIVLTPFRILLRILKIPLDFICHIFSIIGNKFKKPLQKFEHYVKIKVRKIINDLKVIIKKI